MKLIVSYRELTFRGLRNRRDGMRLIVYYGNIKKTFEGDNVFDLFDKARNHKLYEESQEIIFELEEVNDGDKCREC